MTKTTWQVIGLLVCCAQCVFVSATCKSKFAGYVEGSFERIMRERMLPTLENEYCRTMQQHGETANAMLSLVRSHRRTSTLHLHPRKNPLSSFLYNLTCDGGIHKQIAVSVEPLFGPYRHPNTIDCSSNTSSSHLMDISYILPADSHTPSVLFSATKFLFDIGASLYGDLSQSGLIQTYGENGIEFDRHLMWEARQMTGQELFSQVPAQRHHSYQYINTPATSDPLNPSNPLNILKRITAVDDFVVLKLDIDMPALESEFIDQILADPDLSSRIDEFYWEPHFRFPELINCCWGDTANKSLSYSDVFETFRRLRNLGIRAHGWP